MENNGSLRRSIKVINHYSLNKEEGEKTQVANIRNERGASSIDSLDIDGIIKNMNKVIPYVHKSR